MLGGEGCFRSANQLPNQGAPQGRLVMGLDKVQLVSVLDRSQGYAHADLVAIEGPGSH